MCNVDKLNSHEGYIDIFVTHIDKKNTVKNT